MTSLISLHNNFLFSSPTKQQPSLVFPFDILVFKPKEFASLGVSCFFKRRFSCLGFVKRRGGTTHKVWESEGDLDLDLDLEEEVLEFMKTSKNPNLFPSKEELIISGRMDLVKSILKQGGWLSFGWDLDEEEEVVLEDDGVPFERTGDDDSRIFQNRFDGDINFSEEFEAGSSEASSYPPSSSGRVEGEENAGIEGILNRLEKERTRSFGFGSKEKEANLHGSRIDDEEDQKTGIPKVNGSKRSSSVPQSSGKDIFDDPDGMHFQSESFSDWEESRRPFKPDMWREWSNRRAGVSEMEFEAAEFGEDIIKIDEMVEKGTDEAGQLRTELTFGDKEKGYNQIRSRIRHLELELTSVLRSLSSQTDIVVSDKVLKKSSEELNSLSDAWEFRETEIMKARDKLRSLRAQLAVLEGKMALKIVEAQKMVEVKQKKIHHVQKALNLLRTACVIWPKSATEVLLVGSFDGWTSQRRMETSSPGIFSLHLRLYPGRYQIKFIVDGVWMVDPLRPIVNNNGHQNNLLIVS